MFDGISLGSLTLSDACQYINSNGHSGGLLFDVFLGFGVRERARVGRPSCMDAATHQHGKSPNVISLTISVGFNFSLMTCSTATHTGHSPRSLVKPTFSI